jgi:DNA-binding NarL/FixJ family response regulator
MLETEDVVAAGCEDVAGICVYVRDFQPDIIVLNASGFEFSQVLRYLGTFTTPARVLACGLRNCGADIFSAIQAGAAACETIDGSLEDLMVNIEALCNGETICPPRVAGILFREVAAHTPAEVHNVERQLPRLTQRERQIVSLVEVGLSNKQIANELSIGLQTVKNHVHNILDKLQLSGRAEAARYAREHGLLIERYRSGKWAAQGG